MGNRLFQCASQRNTQLAGHGIARSTPPLSLFLHFLSHAAWPHVHPNVFDKGKALVFCSAFSSIAPAGGIRSICWPGGSSQSGQVLLRHPASQLGARDQREHQRTHPAVSAQRSNHGPSYPKRVRLNRPTPQQPTKKKTWLQNTQSMLPSDLANVALQS